MKKRLLALLLAVVLTVSCLPHVVLAEGTQTEQQAQETTEATQAAVLPVTVPEPHSHEVNSHVCEDCEDENVVWQKWDTSDALPQTSGHYYLACEISLNNVNKILELKGNKDVVLCLNGYTINCNGGRRAFAVYDTCRLTIVDCTAHTDAEGNYVAGQVINGKTKMGGAVYAQEQATFQMLAGKLADAQCDQTSAGGWGGGVIHARNDAKIILKNCEISGGSCAVEGGMIAMRQNATLEMDGVTVKGNTATSGGAIYADSSTNTITLKNCTFENNTSATAGGAIYSKGSVTAEKCTFKKNSATTMGGAIAAIKAKVTLTECTIENNTATKNGGAFYLEGGSLTITDGTITGNSGYDGGAGYFQSFVDKDTNQKSGVAINIYGNALIENNTASHFGGAFYLFDKDTFLTMHAGKISGNTADNGGAIALATRSGFKMNGGEISGNTAKRKGGALYLNGANVIAYLVGGSITGNSAKTGGAIHQQDNKNKLIVRGGTITGNTASEKGGAIYFETHATANPVLQFEMKSALQIHSNTAAGVTNNVQLVGKNQIKFANLGTGTGKIGVTTEATTLPHVISNDMGGKDLSTSFVSDVPGLAIVNEGGKLTFKTGHVHSDEPDTNWIPVTGNSLPTQSGHYFLTGDIEQLAKVCELSGDTEVVLCLNGYTIDAKAARRVFKLLGNSKLTIVDCQAHTDAEGNYVAGQITNGSAVQGGLVYMDGNSTFQMLGGKLTNGKDTQTAEAMGYGGGAIHARGNATIILKDCEVSGNHTTAEGGVICLQKQSATGGTGATAYCENVTFKDNSADRSGGLIFVSSAINSVTMKDCTVENTTSGSNGGVFFMEGGSLTVTGGSFTGNAATKFGGVLYAYKNNATVTMKDVTMSGNSADNGGAMIVGARTTVTLDECTFINNTAQRKGGAIYLNSENAVLYLNGCTITGNTAKTGAAVHQEANKNTLVIRGGTITGNTATDKGGAIYCDAGSVLQLELQSALEIQSNTAAGVTNNVHLVGDQTITFANLGDGTAKVGVTVDSTTLPRAISSDMGGKDLTAYFVADEALRTITNKDGKLYMGYPEGHQHCDCSQTGGTYCDHTSVVWIPWQDAGKLPTTSGHYYLTGDVKLTGRVDIAGDVVLCLNGYTVNADAKHRIFIKEENKLTVTDCTAKTDAEGNYVAGALTGGKSEVGGVIYMDGKATFRMFGGKLSGNESAQVIAGGWGGGAIHARGDATILLVGCEIADNHAITEGGVITLRERASLVMDGVTARNNVADIKAGVIYSNNSGCKVTLKDSAFESNAVAGDAGGVLQGNGTFEVTGCAFTGNTAKYNGGAIMKNGGKLTITNSTFTGNSGNDGGALRIVSNAEATITGCTFTENTASGNGGVISAEKVTLTLENNTMSKNTAASKGGAVYFTGEDKLLTVVSGTFSENTAKQGGGAIFLQGRSDMLLKDGTFTNNVATVNNGGAIYVNNYCSLTMDGGTITGNESNSYGGGIYALGSDVTINGGEISGNKAPSGAGIAGRTGVRTVNGENVRDIKCTIVMNGGLIADNEATDGGGGVIYGLDSTFTMNGGEISGNKATNGGGFIVLEFGKFVMKDGLITKNSSVKNGGGIYVSRQTEFVMDGGKITENHADQDAGAVKLYGAKMTMNGGEISKNECKGSGAAIQTSNATYKEVTYVSELIINDGAITGNESKTAAAIYVIGGKVNMAGGKVNNNHTAKSAGAVVLTSKATMKLSGGTINNNRADITCGGIYMQNHCTFTMTGGSVSYNSSKGNGAGIYATNNCTLMLSGGSISGNSTQMYGGGIWAGGCTVGLYGTYIGGNYAKGQAGGVVITSYINKKTNEKVMPRLTIDGSTIADNTCDGPAGGLILLANAESYFKSGVIENNVSKGNGGGIYVSAGHTLHMSGGEIRNNTAFHGGGIYHYNSNGFYTGGNIHHNIATSTGGGMCAKTNGTIELKNMTINDNSAVECGGIRVIQVADVVFRAVNCEFSRNIATKSHAGAMSLPWGLVEGEITGCTFADNSCGYNGGAIWTNNGVKITFTDCTFINNTAGRQGGAVSTKSPITFKDCAFSNNKAEQEGGAIFWNVLGTSNVYDPMPYIYGGTFENNSSQLQGGAIYLATGCYLTMDGTTLKGNTSKLEGSVLWTIDDTYLSNLTVTDNVSENGGYAIYYAANEFDGLGYYRGFHKTGGQMIVKDNKGGNVYYGEQVAVSVDHQGLIGDTYMDITLHSGLLTQSLIGAYNYEGGNGQYVVTAGDRSWTDPEFDASMLEQETPAENPTETPDSEHNEKQTISPVVLIGGGAMAAIIAAVAIIIVAVSKKKKTAASK